MDREVAMEMTDMFATKTALFPALALVLLASCSEKGKEAPPAPTTPTTQKQPAELGALESHADTVKRGETLVKVGGCSDCHTPMAFDPKVGMPVPQMDRLLSGHPEGAADPSASPGKGDQAVIGPTFTSFRLPFGVVYAQNLTPDPETGLRMDRAAFIATMRSGRHRGAADGRPVLPPMPWMNLQSASEADLGAMHAYMQSLRPIKNAVPEPRVPPPVIAEIARLNGQMAAAAAPKGTASSL